MLGVVGVLRWVGGCGGEGGSELWVSSRVQKVPGEGGRFSVVRGDAVAGRGRGADEGDLEGRVSSCHVSSPFSTETDGVLLSRVSEAGGTL